MPYQFDTGEIEVIDLLDSSEDEDDVVTPTSHRRSLGHRNESTAPTNDSTDSEDSHESSIDDVDELEVGKRTTRLPLQHGSTLKLKRELQDLNITAEGAKSDSEETDVLKAPQGNARRREAFRGILKSMEAAEDIEQLYPKSLRPTFQHTEALSDEHEVLLDFVSDDIEADEEQDVFEELELHDFSIYRGILQKAFPGQFESPHVVSSEQDDGFFYIDGIICHGGKESRIVGAVIHDVNIGGLLDISTHTSAHQIWVQTKRSRRRCQCWYRLTVPSAEYSTTWHDFLWLADLNKHVIDYLKDSSTRCDKIQLHHFETAFWEKLLEWHELNEDFDAWSDRCGRVTDFRMHITIHASFLRDQAWSVSGQDGFDSQILDHPVWESIGAGKFTEDQQSSSHHEKTVVTPNVATAFTRAFPKWGHGRFNLLSAIPISPKAAEHRDSLRLKLGLPDKFTVQSSGQAVHEVGILLEAAATANQVTSKKAIDLVGKVVIVRPLITQSVPRARSYEEQFRFAFVHEVTRSAKALRVIWLALPRETTCGSEYDRSFYPVTNELFYTEACNCRPVAVSKIVGVYDASVFPDALDSPGNIIVQLLYSEREAAFLDPETTELLCDCQHPSIEDVDLQPHSATTVSHHEAPHIRNMSLFSGCGLLDSGLEEGGNFETVFVLDHNELAVCSHAANGTSDRCTHVVGSVNPHLRHFLTGETPMPEVDCITAGCPCKGYSLLNAHRHNKKAQRNCSLLASVLSWTDLFLPKLVLIENVPRMDFVPTEKDLANACAQAICCLVAMGYQVRKVILPAYEYGSPTLRTRLFLIAAAPGVPLPERPEPTHGDEPGLEPIVTVGDVLESSRTSIHNDSVVNIQDPTHIPIQRLKPIIKDRVSTRNLVKRIPKAPGSGLYQAHQKGLLSKDQKRWYYSLSDEQRGPKSKTLRRVDPHDPFKTMVTIISPLDCRFGGEIVHPYEDRLLSLKEIRRAQGIPDSFLLMGNLKNQIELVGNGVAWQVAAALGRSFGHSWSKYCEGIEDLDNGHDKSRLTQRVLQLPQKISATFTEITKAADDGNHLQRRMRETPLEEDVVGTLPEGDTVEVKTQSSESASPVRENAPRIRTPVSGSSPTQERKVKVSIPITNSRTVPKAEVDSPPPVGNGPARDRSASEEVYEMSDHENLVITPNGTYNYQRSQRGKITRRSSSTKKLARPVPIVIIPTRKKRPASPTPPPLRTTQSKASRPIGKDESDSEIEYLETRPVAKKKRVIARVEDWYDD